MNIILRSERCRLHSEHVQQLTLLSVEGPLMSDVGFTPNTLDSWCSCMTKDRWWAMFVMDKTRTTHFEYVSHWRRLQCWMKKILEGSKRCDKDSIPEYVNVVFILMKQFAQSKWNIYNNASRINLAKPKIFNWKQKKVCTVTNYSFVSVLPFLWLSKIIPSWACLRLFCVLN